MTLQIAGMSIDNYDSDRDVAETGGRIGLALADAEFKRRRDKIDEVENEKAKYIGFLDYVERESLAVYDFGVQSESKMNALERFFPGQMKRQKLRENAQNRGVFYVGALFRNMIEASEEQLSKR
jgi:hypothetical protein